MGGLERVSWGPKLTYLNWASMAHRPDLSGPQVKVP